MCKAHSRTKYGHLRHTTASHKCADWHIVPFM